MSTDYKERASEIFHSQSCEWFEMTDTFNPGNLVEGYICKSEGPNYGSMLITHVNHTECPQVIRSTPKIPYPFDKSDRWVFPKVHRIFAYEKFDGTNIVMFRYLNGDEFKFYSFKTRLMPFVRQSRFGDFLAMWNKILTMHPRIMDVWDANGCNISFELYGSANVHLVVYDVPIDTAILFGMRSDGEIVDPKDLEGYDVPKAPTVAEIDSQYVENYKWQQNQMGDRLKELEDKFKGEEGQVWYCHTDNGVTMFKCKPSQIEAIHFAQGKRISKHSVTTTCWNALENVDNLTYDFVAKLLEEEFSPEMIDLSKDLIMDCVRKVAEEAEFKRDVIEEYNKFGVNIIIDKNQVMRYMSTLFPKNRIRSVYSTIMGVS